jgi:RNA polymerase sigma factor (sigma-70 family)
MRVFVRRLATQRTMNLAAPTPPLHGVELDAAAIVAANLPAVHRAIHFVARQRRLSPDEAEELASDVYLKLLQHDAAALRGFRGESGLGTFLVVVVQRVLLDARIARSGKWRPSASARRLGEVAIALERLVFHDGLCLQEAAAVLRGTHGIGHTDDELHFLLSLLPPRARRRMVSDRELDALAASGPDAEELFQETEMAPVAMVQRALATLPAEDRRLVELRFHDGLRLVQIARQCGMDERAIYRHFHRVLGGLRASLRPSATEVGHSGARPSTRRYSSGRARLACKRIR